MTPREFLVSKGLAKAGRGKFSKDAHDALNKARAEGVVFDEPRPTSSVITESNHVAKVTKKKSSEYNLDPRAVREWANANNVAVGKRGRIHPDVYEAYLAANAEKTAPERKAVPVGKDLRQAAERVRMSDSFVGNDNGNKITRTYRDCCACCKVSMGWCVNPAGPVVYGHDTETLVRLTGK